MHRSVIKLLCLLVASATPLALTGTSLKAQEAPDSARMLNALRFLSSDALEGRQTGSEGSAQARAYLTDAFEDAGLMPLGDAYEHPFQAARRGGDPMEGVNLLGWVRGTVSPDRYIIVSAHYDHEGVRREQIYNGADDNASGTAALIELAHALRAKPAENSVIIAAWDAEEIGLLGATAFVQDPPVDLTNVVLNVNMDMVARGEGLLWAGGAYQTPALGPILEAVAASAPVTLRLGHDRPGAPEGADWSNSSDHAPFNRAGIPFVYFGVEDHVDYHRPTDDFENVDPANYLANIRTIFAAIRALDRSAPFVPGS